jgi:hypothetical protein
MTPQLAITLVALIALMIGAAFKTRFNLVSRRWTQLDFSIGRKRYFLLAKTWVAGLVAASAAVAAFSIFHHDLVALIGSSGIMFGAVTFNWLWPATGAVTPTAAAYGQPGGPADQATVDVTTDGVATTFTVTHNLNISAADITAGFPIIIIEPNSATGIPATLLLVITRPIASGNAVIFTCAAIAATFRVRIQRPYSVGR